MAYALSDLQAFTRDGARNAQDCYSYIPARIDRALQMGMLEWARITNTPRVLNNLTLTIGSATVPAFATGFLPEFLIDIWLELSGYVIDPHFMLTTVEEVLKEQVEPCRRWWFMDTPTNPATTPPLGRPTAIAWKDQTNAFLNTLADKAYTVQYWWRQPLTLWTPGGVGPTFNLPDDALVAIASLGAPYYLQRNEPANAASAKEAYTHFLDEAKRFRSRAAGDRGSGVLVRSVPHMIR